MFFLIVYCYGRSKNVFNSNRRKIAERNKAAERKDRKIHLSAHRGGFQRPSQKVRKESQ